MYRQQGMRMQLIYLETAVNLSLDIMTPRNVG